MDVSSIGKFTRVVMEKKDKHQFKMKIAAELANRLNKHKLRFTMFSFVGQYYTEEWARKKFVTYGRAWDTEKVSQIIQKWFIATLNVPMTVVNSPTRLYHFWTRLIDFWLQRTNHPRNQ
jgi:hypothetical protein